MYGYPQDQILTSSTIYSLNTSYCLNSRIGRFIIAAAINNLSDEAYDTLLGYPEPPRSFRLTLNYEIN
jgi:outer membrane receptor protein involved in Fe transport